jgi:hypothetical protein
LWSTTEGEEVSNEADDSEDDVEAIVRGAAAIQAEAGTLEKQVQYDMHLERLMRVS